MKKYITISLFIFWAVVVAVMAAGLISINNNQTAVVGGNTNNPNQTGINNITGVNSNVTTLTLSKTELAKHNSSSSCWLLISGKIYDVTNFLIQHPGGESTIIPTCGTDATVAYDTKDKPNGGSPHSSTATAMLADYFIGNLNQTLTLNSGKTPTPTGTKTPSSTTKTPPVVVPPVTSPVVTSPTQTTLALTMTELAKHNSSSSCWLLISGKIYDVTTYLNQHPGGTNTILPTCGTDATTAYSTRGGTGTHSSGAVALLAAYFIGNLNQTVTTSPTNPTMPSVANPNPTIPTGTGRDDDD